MRSLRGESIEKCPSARHERRPAHACRGSSGKLTQTLGRHNRSPFVSWANGSDKLEERTADVYVRELKPLMEGEEKHVISVFVADESGLINRVAGVFGRRGANIESLAVGLTVDKALFTIVVTGTKSTVANLVKQLSKLVKVRYVEDITLAPRVEREMLLLKLAVSSGSVRAEVLQMSKIFRGKVVDVSDSSLTLCITGDPGKCAAAEKTMGKYGILEVARTGRVCLKRGGNHVDPQIQEGHARKPEALADRQAVPLRSRDGDVYAFDNDDNDSGVWNISVRDILEPTFGDVPAPSDHGSPLMTHTLSIEVLDMPGVLNQVTGVFARRGYNVQSLAVGHSERPGMSRICMVVPGTDDSIAKLFKQLSKLVYVHKLADLTKMPFINRELLLIKVCKQERQRRGIPHSRTQDTPMCAPEVSCMPEQRGELRHLAEIFRADILDVSASSMVVEIVGKEDKLKALTDLLEPYGIMEIARTGRIALPRESGLDNTFLEKMATTRVY